MKLLKKILKREKSNSVPEKCKVFGKTMYLQKNGPQYRQLAKTGIWEKSTTEYFLKNISKAKVVLDIGANIGYYTLLSASNINKAGHVFAFEPEPTNFEILTKNVKINNLKNVKLENAAVTNFNGTTELYLSETAAGQHRIYESDKTSKKHITVKSIRLDDYFKNHSLFDKISLIKLDVEGSEFAALKGMEKILIQNNNIELIMEFSPSQIKEYGEGPIILLEFLKDLEFNFYSINKDVNFQVEFDDMKDICKKFENFSNNLLCKRKNLVNN